MNSWWARSVAVVAAVTLAATGGTTAAAERVTYDLDGSRYVRSISIQNGATDVVLRFTARRTPRSVRFSSWSAELDTVADHRTDVGAAEFAAFGPWRRAGVRLVSFADDGSYGQTRVVCDGLRTSRAGRVKTVIVPRSCLVYGDAGASAVRANAAVSGDRMTRSGGTCWAVVVPRRGFTPWLAPGNPSRAMSRAAAAPGSASRGC